jgi:hypothetical protein
VGNLERDSDLVWNATPTSLISGTQRRRTKKGGSAPKKGDPTQQKKERTSRIAYIGHGNSTNFCRTNLGSKFKWDGRMDGRMEGGTRYLGTGTLSARYKSEGLGKEISLAWTRRHGDFKNQNQNSAHREREQERDEEGREQRTGQTNLSLSLSGTGPLN